MGLFRRNKNPRNIDEILPPMGAGQVEINVTAFSTNPSSAYEYAPLEMLV